MRDYFVLWEPDEGLKSDDYPGNDISSERSPKAMPLPAVGPNLQVVDRFGERVTTRYHDVREDRRRRGQSAEQKPRQRKSKPQDIRID